MVAVIDDMNFNLIVLLTEDESFYLHCLQTRFSGSQDTHHGTDAALTEPPKKVEKADWRPIPWRETADIKVVREALEKTLKQVIICL